MVQNDSQTNIKLHEAELCLGLQHSREGTRLVPSAQPSGLVWFLLTGVVILDTAPLCGAVSYRLAPASRVKYRLYPTCMKKPRLCDDNIKKFARSVFICTTTRLPHFMQPCQWH